MCQFTISLIMGYSTLLMARDSCESLLTHVASGHGHSIWQWGRGPKLSKSFSPSHFTYTHLEMGRWDVKLMSPLWCALRLRTCWSFLSL